MCTLTFVQNEWRYFKMCSLPDQKSGCKLSAGLEVSVSNEYVSISEALVLFVMKMTVLSDTRGP